MSEEDLNNVENSPEDDADSQSDKRNKFLKIGKIFLLIAVIVAQGIAAYAIIQKKYPDIRQTLDGMNQKGGVYYKVDNIIINPANSNGERYLILSLAFEMNNSNDVSRADKMSVEIIDKVNSHLIQKTVRELSSVENRVTIKNELINEVNDLLERKAVRNLFITKYVIQ
ncbi:MAG: flagellar basal body-associated protein FliL [Balneolaceae bacterium]